MSTIPVFVTLGGGQPVIIDIPRDAYVGHLVKVVIAELKLGITADRVILRFPPGGDGQHGAVLDPRKTLVAAGVHDECELVVVVMPALAATGTLRRISLSL